VAVVGPFRSGTSCVAGILHTLGVSMGAQLPSPEQTKRFNPKGTFEAVWLAQMCRRFFKEPEMIEQVPRPQRIAELRRWAEERTRQLGPGKLIGAKHPTLCLMVEDMLEAWPDVRFIAVSRPAEEAIKSALAVGWLPTAERVIPMMIETRNQSLKRVSAPVLWLDYSDLLKNPADAIERLTAFCGIEPTSRQIEAAVAFVDPNLRHQITATGVA
ncbi:MAG: sulfotransferase, partial [Synergistales bacterium]|nr:sulfotransferase [Synergistales bacterium]